MDSVALCQNLGVQLLHPPDCRAGGGLCPAIRSQLSASHWQGLPLENLQARIRGTVLMEYSNAFGHLPADHGQ